MLRFLLVLVVASSALAHELAIHPRVPNPLSSAILERAYYVNINKPAISALINDENTIMHKLADLPDPLSHAISAAQGLAVLIKLVDGIPGDDCWTTSLINTVISNDHHALPRVLHNYVNITNQGIDHIVQLNNNRSAAKFSRGVTIGCRTGGRVYDIKSAWSIILSHANSHNIGLLTEQCVTVQRLYNSLDVRNNNVAAAATASALPPVVAMFEKVYMPIADFLRSIGTPKIIHTAEVAKAALNSLVSPHVHHIAHVSHVPLMPHMPIVPHMPQVPYMPPLPRHM